MIIAIDFDGTIADSKFPDCGTIKPNAKEVINTLFEAGHEIIIWTCRFEKDEHAAKEFLDNHGVKYHKINEHMDWAIEKFGNNTRKIFADIYIDDKNVGGLPDWLEIYNILKTKHLI